jgi:hypothetical protein
MRVSVRNNLPVHPRNASLADDVRVLLDIGISGRCRQSITRWAIVVGSVEVALSRAKGTSKQFVSDIFSGSILSTYHSPFLHDELLSCILGLLYIWQELILVEVSNPVGVDRNHVERITRKVRIWRRGCEVGCTACRNQDIGPTLEVALDCASNIALPLHQCVLVLL